MLYKEFLTHYKNQNTVPKGFWLKFNLALCVKNKELQATIQKQLTELRLILWEKL